MYSAIDIANWFLAKNNAEAKLNDYDDFDSYDRITHLKLQKLLYYAQGIYLSLTGNPLFKEKIYAWRHGPVVREVYNIFSCYGRNPIIKDFDHNELERVGSIEFDDKAINALELTYENFNIYTAWQLREMSHKHGSPWDLKYDKDNENVIPNELIKDYFDREIME